MKNEIWKDVVGWEGRYQVSNLGRVRSLVMARGSKILKRDEPLIMTQHTGNGYKRVYLSKLNITIAYSVHRLVLEAFVGPAPKGRTDCAHIDGKRDNNNLSNLIWASRKENCAHKVLHGTAQRGMKAGCAKLTDADVLTIRARRKNGETLTQIAKDFPIAENNVWKAMIGETWKHLPL